MVNSLNSNHWNPRILCNASKGVRGSRKNQEDNQDNLEEACGRYRSSTVHPDRFPPFLSQDWWYAFSASVLVETGLAQSRLFIIESFPHTVFARNPSRCSWIVNPSRSSWLRSCCCFPKASFGCCMRSWLRSCCGFQNLHFHFLLWSSFQLCVMWCWLLLRRSVSLHWRISLVGFDYFFSFSRYFHVVLLQSLCNFLRVESIFRGLLLCWSMFCWFGCCFQVKFSVSSSTSLRNSLMSSSHLFLGLPIALLVLYFELSSGFHSAAFINHLSLGDVAILSASLRFHFLWVLFQHRIFAFSIFSMAPFVLLFKYSIQSVPSISVLRRYRSQMTRRCPGRCECLSFAHLSYLLLVVSVFFFVGLSFRFTIFLYLLFVCMMSRSILRCVDWIILSCSSVGVHVPDA